MGEWSRTDSRAAAADGSIQTVDTRSDEPTAGTSNAFAAKRVAGRLQSAAVDSTVVAAIVGGVAGVVTGGISSVIAPWANWGVEKRQLRRQERVTQIAGWRDVARMYPDGAKLLLDGRYFSLRPHLTPQEREAAEALEQGARTR